MNTTTITVADAHRLLALVSTFDGRNFSDPQAAAWSEVLNGYTIHEAKQAVIAWYRENHGYIQPASLIREIEATRKAAYPQLTSEQLIFITDHKAGMHTPGIERYPEAAPVSDCPRCQIGAPPGLYALPTGCFTERAIA